MYQTPEHLIALNKANVEAALRFAGLAIEGAERLIDLQLKTAKSALADGLQSDQRKAARGVHGLVQHLRPSFDLTSTARSDRDGSRSA